MDKKPTKARKTPDECPLVFEKDEEMTCSIKLIPCKIYQVYGFCPIYSSWKSSKKFCTVHLEQH